MAGEMTLHQDEVMTLREVAEALGVSRQTVRNLVRRGLLARYVAPVGGPKGERTYYLRSEVERLASENVFRRRAKHEQSGDV